MFLPFFVSFLTTLLLIYNIFFLRSPFLGAIFFLTYLSLNSYFADNLLKNLLPVGKILRWLIGIFIVFYLLFSLGAVSIILYRFNNSIIAVILILTGWLFLTTHLYYSSKSKKPARPPWLLSRAVINFFVGFIKLLKAKFKQISVWLISFRPKYGLTPLCILLAVLFLIGFYTLLASGEPNKHILTPWQAIPAQFIWVIVLLAAIILGLIIFRARPLLLLPIILFSLLLHLYIPAVYQLPFGGDSWRHMSSMAAIEQTGNFPVEKQDYISFGKFKIPSAFITAPSYASLWSNNILAHKILHLDLITIITFAPYLLFSLFVPLLVYVLFSGFDILQVKNALLGSFLLNLFFPIQAYGSVALPVGIGFLCFLLFLITVRLWIKKRKKFLLIFLGIQLFLLFWGYIIYFIFAALIIGFLLIYYYNPPINWRVKLLRIFYLLASIALIPVLSLWFSPNARFVVLSTGLEYAGDFWKHFFLYFLGFKPADDFHLQTGNLIWQKMAGSSSSLWPFKFEYFDTLLLMGILILLFIGLRALIKKIKISIKQNNFRCFPALILYLLAVVFGGIFLDNYYLGGIHLLTERLDLIADFLFIILLIYALSQLIADKDDHESQKSIPAESAGKQAKVKNHFSMFNLPINWRVKQAGIILLLSLTIGSTYLSGPIHGRITKAHYQAMQALYQEIKKNRREDYCIIAEHFPLLALEAISAGQLKNGNFPIKYGYFEERGQVFIRMFSNPKIRVIQEAMKIAQTPCGCYFILDSRFMANWSYGAIRDILGEPIIKIDDVYVWRYDGA